MRTGFRFIKRKDLVSPFLRKHGISVPEGIAFSNSAAPRPRRGLINGSGISNSHLTNQVLPLHEGGDCNSSVNKSLRQLGGSLLPSRITNPTNADPKSV